VSVLAVSSTWWRWASEQGLNLPCPVALKRPDSLVLGPAAGQGRPDRLQCQGFLSSLQYFVNCDRWLLHCWVWELGSTVGPS
jgi:hypothetical protein